MTIPNDAVLRINGTINAESPIVHFGDEKTGSTPVLRSMTIWEPESAEHVRLPFISGNAIRGMLRRLVMRDFLDRIGYESDHVKLYHALFTGGILETDAGGSGSRMDMALRDRMRTFVPPIAVLGTAIGNQIFSSCLNVNHAMPICAEYASHLDDIDDSRKAHPIRTFTDVSFATRRDDLRAERDDDEQARQMKIEFEAFVAGTGFRHGFAMTYANDVEQACLGHMLNLWRQQPYIGGKSGSGYGNVAFDYEPEPAPNAYIEWCDENAADAQAVLNHLEAALDGREPGTLEV